MEKWQISSHLRGCRLSESSEKYKEADALYANLCALAYKKMKKHTWIFIITKHTLLILNLVLHLFAREKS